MARQVLDPETMPLEELRQKTAEAFEQPRDEKGRFAKVDEHGDNLGAPEPETVEAVPEEKPVIIVRREVDLGDGSGVQIFKGVGETQQEAYEDFADKLAEAQRNATRKIRLQEEELRKLRETKQQTVKDEDYVLEQKFKENPAQAIKEAIRRDREEQQRVQREQAEAAAAAAERGREVQQRFVDSHPEYVSNERNGNRMVKWLQTHGETEFTEQNLEKAFEDLSASGLLELKPEEADGTTDGKGTEPERIAQTVTETTQPRVRRSSSTVRGGSVPVRTGLSEDELYRMPMDELAAKTREAFTQRAE